MKKRKFSNADPKATKRKLTAAICMLLVATVLMATTSYAWLVLSIAPEVTGIKTQVVANGSLEIALLNTLTRTDLSAIPTAIGQSLATNKTTANNTWGNLVDLNDASYGLTDIVLSPARLNIVEDNGQYKVQNGMLSVPTYGFDGRIVDLTDNTVSAIKKGNEFSMVTGQQDYGVRAVGTSSTLTVQASALAMAKGNIYSYTQSARNAAISALSTNGNDLLGLMVAYFANTGSTFDDADLKIVKNIISDMETSVRYVDNALRQGLIAVAAAKLGDESLFEAIRTRVNSGESMLDILADVTGAEQEFVTEFTGWVAKLESMQNSLNTAKNKSNELTGGAYTWDQIKEVLMPMMNLDKIYIKDTLFPELGKDDLAGMLGGEITMSLASGSGLLADLADFVGNYKANFSAMGTNVAVETLSAVGDAHLIVLYAGVSQLEPAGGAGGAEVVLSTTYGYALDMAFRTNAAASNLLLQTSGTQRVYEDSAAGSTMGGGSYMEFASQDTNFTVTQVITLMDAIRVAFVDDQNNVLGIAKLNTSNRTILNSVVTAPLYLYDFELSKEAETLGALVMGERKKVDNAITELQQNVAKAVTVLVWLDGDIVDNSMVAASSDLSMTGTLNLQFASSANLIPAVNGDLSNITADVEELEKLLTEQEAIFNAGQGTYTSVSWNAFTSAYEYAKTIKESGNPSDTQVYWANYNLQKAASALEKTDMAALTSVIDEVRELMGQTQDPARYVLKVDDTYISVNPATAEQNANKVGTIYRVDYNKNLRDEGNGILNPIYTDESWTALANALYDAETFTQIEDAIPVRDLDKAITALDSAYKALEHKALYIPYDYQGALYYQVQATDPADQDSYGKWYDGQFKRVVADLTILKLDAEAVPATIADIEVNEFVRYGTQRLAPMVVLKDDVYADLKDEEIMGVNWSVEGGSFAQTISQTQVDNLQKLVAEATALTEGYAVDEALVTAANDAINDPDTTYTAAAKAITDLAAAIQVKSQNKAEQDKEEAEADNAPMTQELLDVLVAAVQSAQSVEGMDGAAAISAPEEETTAAATEPGAEGTTAAATEPVDELEGLKKAVEQANSATTNKEAKDALAALNAELVKHGKQAITVENFVKVELPGSDRFDLVYAADSQAALLRNLNEGKTEVASYADTTIKAVVITKGGVVISLEKKVSFYVPADNVKATKSTKEHLQIGETLQVDTVLEFSEVKKDLAKEHSIRTEAISSMIWSSDDDKVATVDNSGNVTAVGAGTVSIRVTVVTGMENEYTTICTVTVDASAEPAPEPTP